MLNIRIELDLGIFVTVTLFNNFQLLSDYVADGGYVLLNKAVTSEIS
jgi:hypothetical protein